MRYTIALGSNLRTDRLDPADIISNALWQLAGRGLPVVNQSRYFTTPAQPQGAGPDFVSAVVVVEGELSVPQVTDILAQIEAASGDAGAGRGAARVLDIDLIAQEAQVLPDELTLRRAMEADDLVEGVLPHPHMHRRAYVLVPMAEVASDWIHPVLGSTVPAMIAALPPMLLQGIQPCDGADRSDRSQNVAE